MRLLMDREEFIDWAVIFREEKHFLCKTRPHLPLVEYNYYIEISSL